MFTSVYEQRPSEQFVTSAMRKELASEIRQLPGEVDRLVVIPGGEILRGSSVLVLVEEEIVVITSSQAKDHRQEKEPESGAFHCFLRVKAVSTCP
jgi:hypothetical protein